MLATEGFRHSRALLYFLFWVFSAAAASELGAWASSLFAFLSALPLCSAAFTIATRVSLRFRQEFSTEHPSKGSPFLWTFKLESALLPIAAPLFFWCYPLPGEEPGAGSAYLPALRRGRVFSKSIDFVCRYRGVYPVGLAGIRVFDPLFGWSIALRPQAQHFYVAPQVYPLLPGLGRPVEFRGSLRQSGVPQRSSLAADFYGMRSFEPGESPSRIHWPSFARSGQLLVREFEGQTARSVLLVLDTRAWAVDELGDELPGQLTGGQLASRGLVRDEQIGQGLRQRGQLTGGQLASGEVLQRSGLQRQAGHPAQFDAQIQSRTGAEDCAVEAFFSLLFAFRDQAVPVRFVVPGWDAPVLSSREELLRRSTGIFFRETFALQKLLRTALASPEFSEIILVSPHADAPVFDCIRLLHNGHTVLCMEAQSLDFVEKQQRMARESAAGNVHILPGPGADQIPTVLRGLV